MSVTHERPTLRRQAPNWSHWHRSAAYSIGIEEEVMVLEPERFGLAARTDALLHELPLALADSVTGETHQAVLELTSAPHIQAGHAAAELQRLRRDLTDVLAARGLRAAAAGTHPLAVWRDIHVSSAPRYQHVYASMRELARREPTFAQHVHIGVPDPERAVALLNRLREHLPLLLAASANSPFWQGRDSGLASARTSIFQAFPRVGIPRAFADYTDYVEAVDRMLRWGAFEDPTFLWWDVRLQPALGTVEVRIMDTQSTTARTGGLAALVQAIAHLELEEGSRPGTILHPPEVLAENRFLAARDGMRARLLDPLSEARMPAEELLERLMSQAAPHAHAVGCGVALEVLRVHMSDTGERRQRALAHRHGLRGLMAGLVDQFTAQPGAIP